VITYEQLAARVPAGTLCSTFCSTFCSTAELDASRSAALAGHTGDLWVFAYGSLMWNPGIPVAAAVPARLPSYRRMFCIDMPHGRGTPHQPGLMLALVPGGSCAGIALRITASDVEAATRLLWLREMAWGAYRASWLPLIEPRVTALTFTFDATRVGALPVAEQAARIADAAGELGSNSEYLFRTSDALTAAGLRDDYLDRLCTLVGGRHATAGRDTSTSLRCTTPRLRRRP
jgi:glutathione-specific gamma-glutamylcyclotransferase